MAIFSVLPFLYLSTSKSDLVLHSIFESISDNLILSQSDVLSKNAESVLMNFSLSKPRIYLYESIFSLTDTQKATVATNFSVSNFADISTLSRGSIELSWDVPTHGDSVSFQIKGDGVLLQDTAGAVSPISFSPLNAAQHLSFEALHPTTFISHSRLYLTYFSSENLFDQNKNLTLLTKIETQDFSGNWLSVESLQLKILSPFGKIKYYVGDREYKGARITLSRNGKSKVMTF